MLILFSNVVLIDNDEVGKELGNRTKLMAGNEVMTEVVTEVNDNILSDIATLVNQVMNQVSYQVNEVINKVVSDISIDLLRICLTPMSLDEIFKEIGLSKQSRYVKRYILPLIEYEWLAMTRPESPKVPNQRYRTTLKGAILLKLSQTAKLNGK